MPRVHPCLSSLILATALVPSVAFAQERAPTSDVPEAHWASDAVLDLAKRGVFIGYADGGFKGKRSVTRQETAVAFQRVLTESQRMLNARTVPAIKGPRGEQ